MNIIFSYISTIKENSCIKRLMLLFFVLPCLFSANLVAQSLFLPKTDFVENNGSSVFKPSVVEGANACITWNLLSDSSVTSIVGDLTGQVELIGAGSSAPFMSVFYPYSNGQRLWVGTTGWVAGPRDPLRYVEFNVTPQTGNNFTVSSISFNYGDDPLTVDFNIINFQAYYSLDNWNTSFVLNITPLIYKNTSMQTFFQGLSVPVASNQVFSLRIFPFAIQNGTPMTPTFATHNNVTICGTTTPEVTNTGSICGIKFDDHNGNGIQDLGEPGIANWQISTGIAAIPYATTDSLGNYCFDSLPVGTYTISEINQMGWIQTSPPNPGTYTLTLSAGQQINNADFGNMVEPPLLGSICGVKFNDLNGNGVRDFGEPGIANWQISTGIATIPNAFTDSMGVFCFNNLPAGNYTISEINQTGWIQTAPPNPGTYSVTLAPGQTVNNLNFGNWLDTSMACITWGLFTDSSVTSTIGNITGQAELIGAGSSAPFMSVFYPYNNGQRLWVGTTGWVAGPRDPLRYVEFNVSPQAGNSFTVTNVSFNYGDSPLTVDFNIINFQAYYSLDNWNTSVVLNTTPLIYKNTSMQTFIQGLNVPVASNQVFSLRIFPFAIQNGSPMTPTFATHNNVTICGTTTPEVPNTGSICGIKFNDLNGNGVQDSGEPGIANWQISAGIAGIPYTTTDSLGNYCFDSLPAGSYTISEIAQIGWIQTAPPMPGTYTLTVSAGQQINNVDFGNMVEPPLLGSICGIKFNDLNGNGIQDSGEPGIANWGISTGIATIPSTFTDSLGAYCFNNLPAGNYTISEINQTGWIQTAPPSPGTYTVTLAPGQTINNLNFGNMVDTAMACITWGLFTDSSVTSTVGNITGQASNLGMGSSAPFMSVFYPYSNGQRLWVGSTGWIAGPRDPLRYVEFNVSPQAGNSFNVTNVSFNYGDDPLTVDFNIINFQAYYSLDNWNTSFVLNTTPLIYKNTSMQTFIQGINVPVASSQIFSLRIFPFAIQNGSPMTPTFAIHNNVTICGTTLPEVPTTGSICGIKFNDLNGNGVQDSGEPGIANWQISAGIAGIPYTTTDSLGNYCFDSLPVGSYTISEINQTGWEQTYPCMPNTYTVTLAGGETIDSISFGNKLDSAVACISWGLMADSSVTSVVGNIFGQPENIGQGSSAPFMSVFYPYNNGQRLWVGTTGWISGSLDPLRYVEFNVAPQTGSSFNVTQVSFNYGDFPLTIDFNTINFQAYYSTNGWSSSTVLNGTPLIYKNTSMLTFVQNINVQVTGSQTFSLRIFPYALLNSVPMTSTFAVHNNVTICGITTPEVLNTGSICGIKFEDENGNGVKDADEVGIPNWQISLNVATIPMATTDSLGKYCFNNIPLGIYTVTEVMQAGWYQTSPAAPGTYTVTLTAGQNIDSLNFGNRRDTCTTEDKVWVPLGTGTDGAILSLKSLGTNLYAGGAFTLAGGVSADKIAKWDGLSWSNLGTGTNDDVLALAVMGGHLYAGGKFTTAGGINTNYIARWDGTTWAALGTGLDNYVTSLAVIGGNLYVGGQFTTAGGVNAKYIARWDGTNWYALGSGMNSIVSALTISGTDLFAGGLFTTAGGVTVNHIARWNGTSWYALGTGMNHNVISLAEMGGNIYAGGSFTTAGGQNANVIAKWDGVVWSALGSGMNNNVMSVVAMGGEIYAGGYYTTAGGVNAQRIAKWNGSTWVGLGLGMNSTGVLALEHKNGVLYAGGAFTTAGTINAANAARYICNDLVAVEDGTPGNFMPDHFRLEQNYPNPFNPMTTLRYDIAKVSFVTIVVYDILGREVISLVNEEKNQGRYEISFDARDLSSGMYFYSIRAGDFSETKMMILMK